MERFIPQKKLSKKAQRAINAEKRKTWAINPLTKCADKPHVYNRNQIKRIYSEQLRTEYSHN